jgi:hypothetical protein
MNVRGGRAIFACDATVNGLLAAQTVLALHRKLEPLKQLLNLSLKAETLSSSCQNACFAISGEIQ